MKKQGVKKPHSPPAKSAGTNAAVKKKRSNPLSRQDKLRAVLVAAVLVLFAAVSSLVIIFVQSVQDHDPPPSAHIIHPAPEELPPPNDEEAPPALEPPPEPPFEPPEEPMRPGRGTLVFVIDDAGHNLRDLQPFLDFPGPITIAVLPGLPYSVESARRVRAAGKELLLHQPMESLGGTNPGPGAIMAGMDSDEIRAIISRNLDELWPVAGMNNHEGSRVTMDAQAMETVLTISQERGILFLDSRTTAQSAAPQVARRLGITIGERDIFVDNSPERESMIYFINRGLSVAERTGFAIMIGHVWSPELAPLLKEMYADLIERGYSFSSVADVIARKQ